LLGQDHDLDVLSGLMESEPSLVGGEAEIELLARVAGAESDRLRTEFGDIAKSMLADEPCFVRSRIEALYRISD
jgi:hypothetical protein